MIEVLKKVEEYANKNYDGHFTLMKFTSNWRACYGTLNDFYSVSYMIEGSSAEEALQNLLNNPLGVDEIMQKIYEEQKGYNS